MDKEKNISTPVIIAITTLAIIAVSNIVALAFYAGRIDKGVADLSREVDKWDGQIISVNKEIQSQNQEILLLKHEK